MPINPQIALGVQPVQPINMLGMAAQGMALQAAAQEMEGNQGVREAIAGGMSPTDPRLLQYGKQGRETFKTGIEARVKQIETAQKRMDAVGGAFGYLKENPGAFADVMRDLVQNGLYTPEQAQQAFAETQGDPTKITDFATRNWGMAQKAKDQISKIIQQDMGGYQQITAVDPLTGKTKVISRTGKTLTPGQAMEERRRVEQGAQINQILGGGGTAPVNSMITAPAGAPVNRMVTPPATATVGAPVAAPVAPTAAPAPSAADVEGSSTATISDTAAVNNVDKITSQITQLRSAAVMGNARAGEAADQLEKQLNLLYPKMTTEIQNFNFAKQQGFKGSFEEWAKGKPLFESEYSRKVGGAAAERDVNIAQAASAAVDNLPKIYETLDQIRTSSAITGFGADTLKNIERFRAQFMADKKAGKRVADTEILDAFLGSDVFPLIGSLGIGARGLDTPAEREFLRGVMTGTISMNRDALIKLTELRAKLAERAIDKYNTQVEQGKLNKYFEAQGLRPEKLEKPKYTPATVTAPTPSTNMGAANIPTPQPAPARAGTSARQLTSRDQQALEWARANPNDPRSAQIKQRLGAQ